MTFNPFTLQDSVILLIVILLLGVSASVSASETAFFSLSPRDVIRLKNSRVSQITLNDRPTPVEEIEW